MLDRRSRELNELEQSIANTHDERTRLQLHSTEIFTSLVAVRQELEDSRAIANAARVGMMDEQLAQTQTIEAHRRQVETSNNAARDAQALLRATQEQQQQYLRMPPPSNLPTTVQQEGTLATLPSFRLCQLHRQGCVQESCMAQDTIMWGHQRSRDMLNR